MTRPAFIIAALTVAFITLKITGVVEWSWWWMLSPLALLVISMTRGEPFS